MTCAIQTGLSYKDCNFNRSLKSKSNSILSTILEVTISYHFFLSINRNRSVLKSQKDLATSLTACSVAWDRFIHTVYPLISHQMVNDGWVLIPFKTTAFKLMLSNIKVNCKSVNAPSPLQSITLRHWIVKMHFSCLLNQLLRLNSIKG